MGKGRSLMALTGKLPPLSASCIATYWKGRLVVRAYPRDVHMPWTKKRKETGFLISFLAPRWRREFTKYQRDGWEFLASKLGSASKQARKDVSRGSKNIIPSRGVLMSGFNLYMGSNIDAYYANFTIPRDEAPFGGSFPPAPCEVDAWYNEKKGEVVVEFSKPAVLDIASDVSVEIWVSLQNVYYTGGHLVAVIPIRNSAKPSLKEKMRYRFSFSRIPSPKCFFGRYELALKELDGGAVRIQLCTVAAYKPECGALHSAGSAVCEVALPKNPKSPITPFVRKFQKGYKEWCKDTFEDRVKGRPHPPRPRIEEFIK